MEYAYKPYSEIKFTYTNPAGYETTFTREIPLCCEDCETTAIEMAYYDFIGAIENEIADKYKCDGNCDECDNNDE
jgi:hypothetical protein